MLTIDRQRLGWVLGLSSGVQENMRYDAYKKIYIPLFAHLVCEEYLHDQCLIHKNTMDNLCQILKMTEVVHDNLLCKSFLYYSINKDFSV